MGFIDDMLSNIKKTVSTINTKITNLPATLFKSAQKRGKSVIEVGDQVIVTLDTSRELVLESLELIQFYVKQIKDWDEAPFQAELSSFLDDIFQLPAEALRILSDVEFDIPDVIANTISEKMSKVTLYGLSQALELLPDWRQKGSELLAIAKQVPSLSEINEEMCNEVLKKDHEDLKKLIKLGDNICNLLIRILELAISHQPSDLSVSASVVGEGGGTEISGHPSKLKLEWTKSAIEVFEKALKKYLDFYDACEASKAAREDAAWKEDVTNRLIKIETALLS